VSDAAQIEIGKKLTKRNSQLGGSASSLTKDKAGKGQLRRQCRSLLFQFVKHIKNPESRPFEFPKKSLNMRDL